MSYERDTCRLCGGKVKTTLELKPTPIANSFPNRKNAGEFYPLELKQCGVCDHVQIGHVIEDAVIYGQHYKYSTPAALKTYLQERSVALRRQYPDAKSVVEIGANNGLFLDALHANGFSPIIGIDPSAKHPLVWNMPFDSKSARLLFQRVGPVDLIVSNNTFAHIDDLDTVFQAIDDILAFDGSVIFEVQYLPAMMLKGAFDMIYHEHRDYHSLRPLARFLQKHNFVMTKYEMFDLHGGSIRVYARHLGDECQLPFEKKDWKRFEGMIEDAKTDVLRQLNGQKVIAFGATAKACTLIHNFGIADFIAYMVDNTPAKQGCYIPGTAIEILPEEALANDHRPLFLTAWNYADYIAQKYPGKRLIVPFGVGERMAA